MARSTAAQRSALVTPVLGFLRCRTPEAWIDAAVGELPTLLLDHASLELKAAQQAQTIVWRYGAGSPPRCAFPPGMRLELLRRMSRLAREELRHFEQVIDLLAARGLQYVPVSASRYARTLHAEARVAEPARLIDTLLIGAVIEARSCERFFALLPALDDVDAELARFYASLLRSEARHYQDYLALAFRLADRTVDERIECLLRLDAELVTSVDSQTRFHSGPPG